MMLELKAAGFIRAGFQYQDLVAIESLIDFYRDRTRFQWIKVEADDSRFRAIDDVVACLPDGRFELTQVKFSGATRNGKAPLDWAWLTASKPRGKSLLQKWFRTTVDHLNAGSLASARLKTNRIPDDSFAQCLKGSFIDFDLIGAEARAIVEKQLGTASNARAFFAAFEFQHSQPLLDDLEQRLWSRVASDTDRGGWSLFREQVERWSTHKNSPGPDGRIRYIHLQQAFSVERATPIPQSFRVPSTYSIPDRGFDDAFRERVTDTDGITVLWGSPGRGKSTYLSHYVARLDQKKAACIRHHYFLSLDDRSEGRFHVQAITRSLEHQIEQLLPDFRGARQTIGQLVESAARELKAQGRRLIVVIDGLDHVWRENRDHEHMEELFDGLLPLVDNCHLVVGTQKITSGHLPARLIAAQPFETWIELPPMSLSAVRKWIELQDGAGRLNLGETDERTFDRRRVADAFHGLSGGLPLHLIYSFEMTARTGNPVRVADVQALPPCPSGDIRDYYRSFLERVSPRAKEILHLLAGLHFGPPPFAIRECIGPSQGADVLAEISHLLEFRETEVMPFHGSLFAFIADLPDHLQLFRAQLGPILAWLEKRAPQYWRDAWLWITKAQSGDIHDLVTKPDRAWAIEFLSKGYPIDQLINVLGHAETAAFEKLALPELQKLRALKTRALNGPEFQTTESSRFFEVAATLSEDAVPTALLRTGMGRAATALLPFIVRAADSTVREKIGKAAIDELNERIARTGQEDRYDRNQLSQFAEAAAGIAANLDRSWARRVARFAKGIDSREGALTGYARASILARRNENVFEAAELWSGPEFDRELLAALSFEGLSPGQRPKVRGVRHPAIRVLALLKGTQPKGSFVRPDLTKRLSRHPDAGEIYSAVITPVLYDAYFECLAARLAGKSASPWARFDPGERTGYAEYALGALEEVACFVAGEWLSGQRWPSLYELYEKFTPELPKSRAYEMQRQLVGVRVALADIAFDHCLLGRAVDAEFVIQCQDLERAAQSPFWRDELWIDRFIQRRYPLHASSGARLLFDRVKAGLDRTPSEFNERADASVNLAMFGADNALPELARVELKRALRCLLGYGWRKDTFVFEALEAIELLLVDGQPEAQKWLLEIAGPIERILDYTDGKETRHARRVLHRLIIDHVPERIGPCFEALIDEESWYYAQEFLEELVKRRITETPAGQALLDTFIEPAERRAVFNAATPSRPHAAFAAKELLRKTGVSLREERAADRAARNQYSSPEPRSRKRAPRVSRFPPGNLAVLITKLNSAGFYSGGRHLLTEWLDHWVGAGQAEAALADLEQIVPTSGLYSYTNDVLDRAANVALETQGRSTAFQWVVRAQIARNSWSSWYTSEAEALARLDFVAREFRDRWGEFVRLSSRSGLAHRSEGGELTVGFARLVYFLLKVGEVDLAKACTRTILETYLDEVKEQPIRPPEWTQCAM